MTQPDTNISIALKEQIETCEMDVKHHWEQYAGEAMYACKRLSDKLEGRIVRFKSLGRPEMRGRIEQVSDCLGMVVVWVVMASPKRGEPKMGKEIYFSDIVAWERP